MKKEKFEKLLLVVMLTSGLVYLYATYFFLPKLEVVKLEFKQLTEQKAYFQQVEDYKVNLSDLQQKIQTLESQKQEIGALVPTQLDKPQIIVDLYTNAKARSVTPESLSFEQIQNKDGHQEMGMSLIGLGKPEDILGLIKDIQSIGKQKFAVQSVKLTTQQGIMRMELKLTGFALRSNPENSPKLKPDFMNSPFGVNSTTKIFQS